MQLADSRRPFGTIPKLTAFFVLLLSVAAAAQTSRTTGTYNALVIFARFADEATGQTSKPAWADDLFDPIVEGSFTHFYNEMSGGQLRVGGQVLPRRYASRDAASTYLASQPGRFGDYARFNLEILEQADADVDMGLFDNDGPDGIPNSGDDDGYVDIVFINLLTVPRDFLIGGATGLATLGLTTDFLSDDPAAGGGVVRVRSQFSGFGGTVQRGHVFRVTAATMCHEFGHVLGLPDLFDQSSVTADGQLDPVEDSAGIGKWGLMGLGTLGWGVEDGPNAFSAWSLAQLGWLGVGNERVDVITTTQRDITLGPIDRGGRVLQIPVTEEEYFLIENRQADDSWYNRNIPAGGLLVWHVDERSDNDEERHKQVDLVSADGLFADKGFPGSRPNPVSGGDNLDFWSRDEAYAAEHNGNQGDATDPFDGDRFRRLAWDTNPGARAHAGARRGLPLGIVLDNITAMSDGSMRLDVLLRQPIAGNVASDTTWTGTVVVDGDVIVEPGATLRLAAGTTVEFANEDARRAGFDTTRTELVVLGDLIIEGSSSAPVQLVRQGGQGRQWLGVLIPGGGSAGVDDALTSGALQLEGAVLGVVRARLPAGRTTWTGRVELPWDLLVPAGAELEIEDGALGRFAAQDLSVRGISPGAVELIVEGSLAVRGSSAGRVTMTVDSSDPTALWYGVRVVDGGSVDVSGLTLSQANVGFEGDVSALFHIADSEFRRLVAGLRLTLFGDATVDRTEMTGITTQAIRAGGIGTLLLRSSTMTDNGREGVVVSNAGLQMIGSRIADNGVLDADDPRSGFVAEGGRGQRIEVWNSTIEGNRLHGVDLDDWDGVFEVHNSSIVANRQDGLRADGAERIVFEQDVVARNLGVGARVTATVSEVWTTEFDNNIGDGLVVSGGFPAVEMSTFTGNSLEMIDVARGWVRDSEFLNATIGLLSTRSAPQIVGNTFRGNITGLRVVGTPVPEPITSNTFDGNRTAIDNQSGRLLAAQGNFWGVTDSTSIAGLVSGGVDFGGWLSGEPTMTAITETSGELPTAYALRGVWPNPFNASTMIAVDLPVAGAVELVLFDVLGRRVRDLSTTVPGAPGRHVTRWDGRDDAGRDVASGLYFVRLVAADYRATQRVVLAR